jgi:predicted transcriptional regulator
MQREMEIEKSIEIIKSLADTSRLRVLNSLMIKPQYVEELANRMNLAVSTVSFHLKKLEKAGLINKQKEQYYVIYSLNEGLFNKSLRELTSFENIELFSEEERVKKYRDKVIKVFMKKGRLTKLPVQHKKKLIILEEFLKLFKKNKQYVEKEVDEIIHTIYDDHCLIRRLLIEEKYMRRDGNKYWIID